MIVEVNQSTQLFIAFFSLIVILFFLWELAMLKIELSDFLFLSSLSILPSIFGFFPIFTKNMASFLGIEFPFLLLFGSLVLILFMVVYRLIKKIRNLEKEFKTMLMDQSINKFTMEKKLKKRKVN